MHPSRWIFSIITGVALFAIGLFVALRPLFAHDATLFGPRWLDFVFAAVFLLRGVINVRTALRRRAAG